MHLITGLTLLAENSWGATRKILHDAIDSLNAQRDLILEAREALDICSIRKPSKAQKARLEELEGRISAAAERIELIRQDGS